MTPVMEDNDWTDIPCSSDIENYDNLCEDVGNITNSNKNEIEIETAIKLKDTKEDVENCDKVLEKQPTKEKDSCPICLSTYEDRSFLDQCFHSFCFCCILQWCEIVQTCPLCKAEFSSLIHNVTSMQVYEQFFIEKKIDAARKLPEQNHVEVIYDYNGYDRYGNRFRYRTTANDRNERATSVAPNIALRQENRRRRQHRTRWGEERRTRHQSERDKGMEKRRQVYSYKLRSISSSERSKKYRNISAKFYKVNQACTHRLIGWLMRDIRVLLGNSEEEINFLMEFILTLITRIDMESAEFIGELRPFLLQTTEHFVHELVMYAKSPFDMIAYDENVVYPWPSEDNLDTLNQRLSNITEQEGGYSNLDGTFQATAFTPWNDTPIITSQTVQEDSRLTSDITPITTSQSVQESSRLACNITPIITSQSAQEDTRLASENTLEDNDMNSEADTSRTELVATISDENAVNVATPQQHYSHGTPHFVCDTSFPSSHYACAQDQTLSNSQGDLSSCFHSKRHKKHKHKHKHHHKRKSKHRTKDKVYKDSLRGLCVKSEIHSRAPGPPSPSLQSMLDEIQELDARIKQHEQQLLSLNAGPSFK